MKFSLEKSLGIIEPTPNALIALLSNLSDDWTTNNEGGNTWTVKETVAHLIVCEATNWLPRARTILSKASCKTFEQINMNEHFEMASSNSLHDLLVRFRDLRIISLNELKSFDLRETDFSKTANHPVIGVVSLQELIASWVTHDLSHIAQIARIMARQSSGLVGNFKNYLRILN